jgi:hypothetical protein
MNLIYLHMKILLPCLLSILCSGVYAQEHFAGINTSRRTGLLNANLNPAELVNLHNPYEVNVLNVSANVFNNKVTFGDIIGGESNFERLLFSGRDAVNLNADVEILGPGFGMKIEKWAFAITSAAKVKANLTDVDVNLGSSVTTTSMGGILGISTINSKYNQRVAATTWGEIGLSAAREIYNDGTNKLSAGITFNLLFPGSYANISVDRLQGTITVANENASLTDAEANLNFAYSGSLANDFSDGSNFTDFFAGGLNGIATNIGFNYQWLDGQNDNSYKLNAGLAFKNLGSMTFKDDNNVSNNYNLSISAGQGLNLSQFDQVSNIREIEDVLIQSGYLTQVQSNKDFKVKLPAMFAAYADYNVSGNWYVTGYLQQKLKNDDSNGQVAVQNLGTITPRYSTELFEAYLPLSINEVSGFTAGIGFRFGGFFIGSGSVLSAAVSDTNQADAYVGFRFGF